MWKSGVTWRASVWKGEFKESKADHQLPAEVEEQGVEPWTNTAEFHVEDSSAAWESWQGP